MGRSSLAEVICLYRTTEFIFVHIAFLRWHGCLGHEASHCQAILETGAQGINLFDIMICPSLSAIRSPDRPLILPRVFQANAIICPRPSSTMRTSSVEEGGQLHIRQGYFRFLQACW